MWPKDTLWKKNAKKPHRLAGIEIKVEKPISFHLALCPGRILCWTDTPVYNLCIKIISPPPDKKQRQLLLVLNKNQ